MIAYFFNNQLFLRTPMTGIIQEQSLLYGKLTFENFQRNRGRTEYSLEGNSLVAMINNSERRASERLDTSVLSCDQSGVVRLRDLIPHGSSIEQWATSIGDFRRDVNFLIPPEWEQVQLEGLFDSLASHGVSLSGYWYDALLAMRSENITPYVRWSRTQNIVGVYYVDPNDDLFVYNVDSVDSFVDAVRITNLDL